MANNPLEPKELAGMRAGVNEYLPDTCHLLTVTTAADGYGGVTNTWGTVSAYVNCRADWVNGKDLYIGGQLRPFTGMAFTMAYDTTITNEYRISHGGYTYNVVSVNLDQSWRVCRKVYAERV